MALAGLVLTVLRFAESDDTPAAGVGESGSAAKLDGSANCPTLDLQSTVVLTELASAQWSMVGAVAAPQIQGVGPMEVSANGVPRCFVETPAGAVLAAANFIAFGTGRPDLGAELAASAIVPGLGQNAAIEAAGAASVSSPGAVQIVGYRVDRYDPQSTDIALAVRADDGSLASGDLVLKWSQGDWKLIVDPGTGRLPELRTLASLGGFTPWGIG
ncbi:hypothetical protein E3T26_12030 [Cryobacterium sp. TMT1-21]|uniref:hypothetical protein n=1 Tax=Cryobacterium sp. TMT1-21 TaxID=1259234 RepID=UPI00106D28F0|nr:hypothetical protein [Cryobacterium sp. TMT1-21]TFD12008.1 hypothetical protein E3T26_12030 [Cryobacterium sp. TMT1-21]